MRVSTFLTNKTMSIIIIIAMLLGSSEIVRLDHVACALALHVSEGLPLQPPPWIKKPDLPHMLLDDEGYRSPLRLYVPCGSGLIDIKL